MQALISITWIWPAGSFFNHLNIFFFNTFHLHFSISLSIFITSSHISPGCAVLLGEAVKGRELLPRPQLSEKQK